jgi:hypothetical protein
MGVSLYSVGARWSARKSKSRPRHRAMMVTSVHAPFITADLPARPYMPTAVT